MKSTTLKQIGEFLENKKPIYDDGNCWTPEHLETHIILMAKRHYNWETDEEYKTCIQSIFKQHYSGFPDVSQGIIYHKIKDCLRTITSKPSYEGNSYDSIIEKVEDEVFFKQFFIRNSTNLSKSEVVDQLILRMLIEISQVSVFIHNGKMFWDEDAVWIMSINLSPADPSIFKISETSPTYKLYE
jgi:hypothetical protein